MITGHLFRPCNNGAARTGHHGIHRVDAGMCWYLARCNRPEREHITRDEYRQRRHVDA